MHKRYLRIDLEYDMDINPIQLYSYIILERINNILNEKAIKIIFSRDSPDRIGLNKETSKEWNKQMNAIELMTTIDEAFDENQDSETIKSIVKDAVNQFIEELRYDLKGITEALLEM